MKLRLLLFLLLFAQQSFGQLKPFDADQNCDKGFISKAGDTLWPGQFKSISRIEINYEEHVEVKIMRKDGKIGFFNSIEQRLEENWIVEKYGKFGLLNSNGDMILPLEYEQLEYARERYLKGKKQNKFGVIQNDNITILPFEYDLIRTEKMEEDVYDMFVMVKDGRVGFINRNFEILLQDGGDISTMKNVEKIQKYTWGLLFVYTRTGETGLYDSENFDWIYEPGKFNAVVPFNHNWSCFWINNGNDFNSKWYIADREGKLVVDQWYDYPILSPPNHCYIVRRNGKYGVLSSDFKDSLPCQYDAITQGRPSLTPYLHVQQGDKWMVYFRGKERGLSKYTFDHVSEPTLNALTPMMVFSGDSIGILSAKDEMILELTLREKVINDYNLCELMQVFITNWEYRANCGAIETNDSIYRKLSNRNIIEYYTNVSTALTPSVHGNGAGYKNAPYISEISPQWDKKVSYHISFAKGGYYSVCVKKDSIDFSVTRDIKNRKFKTEYHNYYYEDSLWKPLTFEELFIEDYEILFEELIREEMDRKLYQGSASENMERSLEKIRNNFYLTDSDLVMHLDQTLLSLSFEQLLSILRNPSAFDSPRRD